MNFTLDAFVGPMDLLLHLIEKNEIDIFDIPIATLTDQYLETIESASLDMQDTSQFIEMASSLLLMKARALLPHSEPEEDEMTKEELEQKLYEYKMFKEAALLLDDISHTGSQYIFKGQDEIIQDILLESPPINTEELLLDTSLQALHALFLDVMQRKELRVDTIRYNFSKIQKDTFTIQKQANFVLNKLPITGEITFLSLFDELTSKTELIVTFLAILELIKQRVIFVSQPEQHKDIFLQRI